MLLIILAALNQGVDPSLLNAVVKVESDFNPNAINYTAPVKSYGLGQLTRDTAWAHCRLPFEKIMKAKLNLECSAKVLAYQLKRYGGDVKKALSAYNAGTYTIKNTSYVERVLNNVQTNYYQKPNGNNQRGYGILFQMRNGPAARYPLGMLSAIPQE